MENLDAKLRKHQQNPPTPVTSPSQSEDPDSEHSIDIDRRILLQWGLDHNEVDQSRRWDQKAVHQSAESIHMRLLSECAQDVAHLPPSLSLLHNEYEIKMLAYNRRNHPVDGITTPRSRAQRAAQNVVSEMRIRGYSAEDMAPYCDATREDWATMEFVAAHCENKLQEMKHERQVLRKVQRVKTVPSYHSMRLRKRVLRK